MAPDPIAGPIATSPRVERASRKAVAEQVEGQHQQEDREPRPDRHPRRLVDVVLRGVEHAAPARRRRLLAQSEERQAGLGDDRRGDRERRLHDQRRDDVGEDVAQRDAQVRVAERARGLDVVLGLRRRAPAPASGG